MKEKPKYDKKSLIQFVKSDSDFISESKENARAYLEELGLNPDEIRKRLIEKINEKQKEISAKKKIRRRPKL